MSLESIISDINKKKKYKLIGNGILEKNFQKIPFTSERLNYMTYGGIPRGCITEFAGIESSGKTTTALDIVKNAQIQFEKEFNAQSEKDKDALKIKTIKKVIYADCENTLDEKWAKLLGVDVDNLIIINPQQESAEEIFETLLQLIETGEVGLLVIDSLGVLVSQQAFDKTVEQKTYGGISQALTTFSKKAVMLCQKTKTTVIGINQVRADLGNPYGGLTTTGGKAWRHNCTLRLLFDKGRYLNEKNEEISNQKAINPSGNIVNVAIEKTKSCRPDRRRGQYILNYKAGIDYISDIIDLALLEEIITQKGAYFYFYNDKDEIIHNEGEDLVFQGKERLRLYLKEHNSFTNELLETLRGLYKS